MTLKHSEPGLEEDFLVVCFGVEEVRYVVVVGFAFGDLTPGLFNSEDL